MRASLTILIFILFGMITRAQTTMVPFKMFLNKDKKEVFELYQKYNAAIAVNPENAQAFFERSLLKYYRNDTLNALADIQKAIALDPKSLLYHCAYARILYDKGEYEAVIHECNQALEINGASVEILLLLGNTLDQLNRPEEARENYAKALQIDSTDAGIYLYYATSYYLTGDLDESQKKLSILLKKNPDSYEGQVLQSLLYKYQKKYNEAIAIIDKLIKTKKDLPLLYKDKAELYDSLNNQPGVCECMYQIALSNFVYAHEHVMNHCPKEREYTPMKVMALQLKTKEYSGLRNYREAVQAYDEIIKLVPDSGLNYYFRGLNKNKMQDYKGALEDYLIAIKKSPAYGFSYLLAAYCYDALGDMEKTKDYYLKCMKVDPLNHFVYYKYAEFITKNGNNYQESVYYYKYAIDINPDYAEAYYALGETYGKLGMSAEACEAMKMAEKLGEVKAISKKIWYCSQ